MTNNIIDFETLRDRRINSEIDEDEARWYQVRDQLIQVLIASEFPDTSLTSATLRALLDVLEAGGMSRADAKEHIAKTLRVFRE